MKLIEENILKLRNQFPFYKKKLENRKLEFENIENNSIEIEAQLSVLNEEIVPRYE